ncbi:MAG: hypothetical protein HYU83_04560 [Chloroflexi bacterium]|nr:hypothetical protein [Chloroflexota bacterium]
MEEDIEYQVMGAVLQEFNKLDEQVRQRVLTWVAGKFSLTKPGFTTPKGGSTIGESVQGDRIMLVSFDSLADAFSGASPETDKDKALAAAAFIQQKFGKNEVTGYEINTELKQLGHGVKNITEAISQLMNMSPKLMIQTRKEGKSKQAKKKYKVTTEGLKVIEGMLNRSVE